MKKNIQILMLILAGKIKNIIIMKTKIFFTTIIIIIIAVLEYFGIDKIILISIMFGVAVGFATWIFIECDHDEEDSATQKDFGVFHHCFYSSYVVY